MHPLTHPVEPHFVHLSWAVRRLTPIQAKYIRTFYGAEVLHQLEDLENRARNIAGSGQRAAGSGSNEPEAAAERRDHPHHATKARGQRH
jgi:hypothetical protein